jgi:hypothetical protein
VALLVTTFVALNFLSTGLFYLLGDTWNLIGDHEVVSAAFFSLAYPAAYSALQAVCRVQTPPRKAWIIVAVQWSALAGWWLVEKGPEWWDIITS